MFKDKKKQRNKVIVLIDFDNLNINYGPSGSMIETLNNKLKQLAKEVGEIIDVFVFLPYQSALVVGETLYKMGLFTVLCPRTKTKDEQGKDTVDETIIRFAQQISFVIPGLTHLCLGSGDKDFVPLARQATRRGLDMAIIADNPRSLATDLAKMADKKPDKRTEKMIYFLSTPD